MKNFPVADPGRPDVRSPGRFLLWLGRRQAKLLAGGTLFGLVWMVSKALIPAAMGWAIDEGIVARDTAALLKYSGLVLGLGLLAAAAGVIRHRFAVAGWLDAAYRTYQLVVRQAAVLGASLSRRVPIGEVVSVGTSDVSSLGNAMEILPRAISSVVAIVVVVVFMLGQSVPLGLAVALGVPVMMALTGPLLRPVHRRQHVYRDQQGDLTSRANDIMAGLRVLRGIGGEAGFEARYRDRSQALMRSGIMVARVESVLWSTQVLLPGALVAIVVWLGARLSVAGQLTPGDLLAFYGYAVFLANPMHTLAEAADFLVRAHVAARRAVRILGLDQDLIPATDDPVPASARRESELTDWTSGLMVLPGQLTAVAAADPSEAIELADRLGRYVDSDVRLNGVPLAGLPLGEVRSRILLADNEALLFAGRLRDELDPDGVVHDETIQDTMAAASAQDIETTTVAERGRNFSGGQQQRLRLARALIADPEVLILVEPTSAVDAHTEARIAKRLGPARNGRTTVVMTTSPLMLDQADQVAYLESGRVVAMGTHRRLLTEHPGYAATVTRGEAG